MSSSYTKNIERLKANQRQLSAQEQGITTTAAKEKGDWMIKEAADIANKLTPFSTALQEWKQKDIEKKREEGRAELAKDKIANAKWLEENGTEYQKRIKLYEKVFKKFDKNNDGAIDLHEDCKSMGIERMFEFFM